MTVLFCFANRIIFNRFIIRLNVRFLNNLGTRNLGGYWTVEIQFERKLSPTANKIKIDKTFTNEFK